jgi:1,2-diacylglycerol 3-alpha-glucosyltransferase
MRIAVLNQSYPPMISGAALFSGHLAEALAERGHEVLVLAASDQGKAYRQRRDNLTIQRFQSYPNPHRVEQRFLLWPANEIKSALRDFAPEAIHLHEPFQMAYFARLYARQRGVPCILTIHALPTLISVLVPEMHNYKQAVEKGLWKYAALVSQQFDVLVTPTETISEMVAERTGLRPRVVSGGVDLRIFHPAPLRSHMATSLREELGIREGAQIILHVGRLDAGKNVQMILQAVGLTIRDLSVKDVHLLCVGDGCEKAHLVKLAQDLGIADNCHFPGYISDAGRLAAIYGMADLFCMASEIETQGLVMLEAAACGLPLVAVKATSMHEIVSDGVNGFLVPAGDVRRMAEAMKAILRDPGLSEKMGLASRQASFAHDFNRTVDAYEEIYLTTIQKRAAQKTRNKAFTDQVAAG